MDSILFLDFDGCLHPDDVYHVEGKPVLRTESAKLFEHADVLADLVSPYPELRIVLSTSWVRVLGFNQAMEYSLIQGLTAAQGYLPMPLKSRVIGTIYEYCTDYVEWAGLSRFDQIFRYVNGRGIASWLTLDDDSNGWPEAFRENLVWVNRRLGLGEHRVREELEEKLARMHSEAPQSAPMPPCGALGMSAAVNRQWEAAVQRLGDAHVSELSTSTRYQAAHAAILSCASAVLAAHSIRLSRVPGNEDLLLKHLSDQLALNDSIRLAITQLMEHQHGDPLALARRTPLELAELVSLAETILGETRRWLDAQ
ncbi:HAD domain-containing protein [Burkholderia pseudomallei]|uniref:HAD domain-containing protein n=1 Tax=Burkholderia pseudomallei TaxID=28450 RepID=UPI000A818F0D|nr:HAD domain-containing protein [Burkholderia pseudomallei]